MMDTNSPKTIKITHNTCIEGWTKSRVQSLVTNNDKALERAVLFIHSMQTRDEQIEKVTKYWNSRGWCMVDAKRGARWAHFVAEGRGIREFEKATVRRVMRKYWRQLLCQIAVKNGYTVVK